MKQILKPLLILTALLIGAVLFVHFDGAQWLSLGALKTHYQVLVHFYHAHAALMLILYMGVYIAVTALSIPGATVLTLGAGAIFGLGVGTLLASFSSTIGATLAFLFSRFFLRDAIQVRFKDRLAKINEGIRREGVFYLFALRLVPLFPFFVINLVMGVTAMRVRTFFVVSQLGMLAGTLAYVNAGTQLGQVDSLKGIVSWPVLASFAVLGLLPLVSKKIIAYVRRKRHA